jgi:hypothetical protein
MVDVGVQKAYNLLHNFDNRAVARGPATESFSFKLLADLMTNKTLDVPVVSEAFLEGLSPKERASAQKHLAAIEAAGGEAHARNWRRLVGALRKLAPKAVKAAGPGVLQFYVADGKYQMQVFSLEDNRDGKLVIYLPDILAQAIKAKILGGKAPSASAPVQAVEYEIKDGDGQALSIESLPSNFPDPPAHMKSMLGWNRKALRVVLAADSTEQARAAEALCEIAAKAWAGK